MLIQRRGIKPGLVYPLFADSCPVQGFQKSLPHNRNASVLRAWGDRVLAPSVFASEGCRLYLQWCRLIRGCVADTCGALWSTGELMLNASLFGPRAIRSLNCYGDR